MAGSVAWMVGCLDCNVSSGRDCSDLLRSPFWRWLSGNEVAHWLLRASFHPSMSSVAPQSIDNRTFHGLVIVPPYDIGPLYNVFLPKITDEHGHEIDDLYPYAVLNKNEPFGGSLTHIPGKIVGATNAFETLQLTFCVSCAAPTELALPVSINPFFFGIRGHQEWDASNPVFPTED